MHTGLLRLLKVIRYQGQLCRYTAPYSIVIDGDVSNLHIIAFQWKSIGLLAQPLAEEVACHPIGMYAMQNTDADKNAVSI